MKLFEEDDDHCLRQRDMFYLNRIFAFYGTSNYCNTLHPFSTLQNMILENKIDVAQKYNGISRNIMICHETALI